MESSKEITSIYKKDNPFDETNDRPISILTILLKAFENLSISISTSIYLSIYLSICVYIYIYIYIYILHILAHQ